MERTLRDRGASKRLLKLAPYLLIFPALVFILVFKIYPIVSVMIGSFFRKGALSLRTYEILFGDRVFWGSFAQR